MLSPQQKSYEGGFRAANGSRRAQVKLVRFFWNIMEILKYFYSNILYCETLLPSPQGIYFFVKQKNC